MDIMDDEKPLPPNTNEPSDDPFPSILGVKVGAWENKWCRISIICGVVLHSAVECFVVIIHGSRSALICYDGG